MTVGTNGYLQRSLPIILMLVGIIAIDSFLVGQKQMNGNAAPPVLSGNNQFAFDLFKNIGAAHKDTNLFFSPASISSAFAMAYAGSDGETRSQMARVLHFEGSQQQVASGFQSLMSSLSPSAKATNQLWEANALWAQQGAHFLPQYISLLGKYYSGDFKTLNFEQTERSLAAINGWVADKTANKIPQLLHPGDINARTRLVLTTAIYFKGAWTDPFRESMTEPDPFTTGSGQSKQVPMMHRTGYLTYAQVDDWQALELPYRGNQLAMVILLPRVEAPDLLADFGWGKLQQMRAQMRGTRVEVFLPKFRVAADLSLAQTLSAMGMPDAFDRGAADFSGITGNKDWFLSAALHQAVIEVNEKGTEAAAATGLEMSKSVAPPEPPPALFRADHPFLYMIIHKPSDSILFIGRLSDPPQ